MAQREGRRKKVTPTVDKQRRIMEAAFDVFSRRGFPRATTAEIAQVAGVAEGTIYNYYRSKRDLLVALVHDSVAREGMSEILDRYCAAPGDAGLLRQLVRHRITAGSKNVDRLLVLIAEIQHDPELQKMYVAGMSDRLFKRLEGCMESGMEEGVFRQMDPAVVARIFLAMNLGLLIIYQLEGESGALRRTPSEEVAGVLAEVFLNGLRSDPLACPVTCLRRRPCPVVQHEWEGDSRG